MKHKNPKGKTFKSKRDSNTNLDANDSTAAAASSSGGNVGRTLLSPNTSIGQHFLKNPAVVDAIVARAGIKSSDIVLEVSYVHYLHLYIISAFLKYLVFFSEKLVEFVLMKLFLIYITKLL